ncbi:hypothetical protein [Mycobacterium intracellulare]
MTSDQSTTSRTGTPAPPSYFEEVTPHALPAPATGGFWNTPAKTGSPRNSSSTNSPSLVALGSITRIRGDFLLGAAVKISTHDP